MNFRKLLTFVIFGVFASIMLSSAASADVLTLTRVSVPSSVSHDAGSFTINYTVSYSSPAFATTNVDFSSSTAVLSDGTVVTISIPSITNLANNSVAVPVTGTVTFPAGHRGTLNVTVVAHPSASGTNQVDSVLVSIPDSRMLTTTRTQDTSFLQNGTFTVRNTGNVALSGFTLTSSGDFPLSFVPSTISGTLAPGDSSSTITVVPTTTGTLRFGTNTAYATVRASDGTQAQQAFTLQRSFCRAGEQGGNLSITRVDISSDGDDDLDWLLLDTISVRVKVENIGSDSIREIKTELGIYDSNGRNRVGDVDFINADDEKINIGTLNDGDNEEVTFQFRVPADFDTGNYKLTVKAYSDKTGESKECTDTSSDLDSSFYQAVSVDTQNDEDKFIVVDDITVPTTEVSCGETILGSFKLFNIGDQDQDQVLVTLKNKDLNLNKEIELRENLDQGDSTTMDFTFDVPRTARDGTYTLEFKTYYDYRSGVYRKESSNSFASSIKVVGCSSSGTPQTSSDVSISADLSSEAKAGQKLTVASTFKNRGSSPITLTLNADGYDSWSKLDSISRKTLTLNAGESKSVDFVFNVNTDVTGTESFTIVAKDDSGKTETQDVEVDFGKATTGSTGFNFSAGNSTLWIIGIINLVLIVLIVLVAIRLARR